MLLSEARRIALELQMQTQGNHWPCLGLTLRDKVHLKIFHKKPVDSIELIP
jgi:hypothetical protein